MKKQYLFLFIIVAVMTIFILTMPTAAAQQGHRWHRRNGDVWVGCITNPPATTWENALMEALSIGSKENRSCWVNRQKGWWIFHRIEKFPVVTVIQKKTIESRRHRRLFFLSANRGSLYI